MPNYMLKKYCAGSTSTAFTKDSLTYTSGEQLYLIFNSSSSDHLSVVQRSQTLLDVAIYPLIQAALFEKQHSQAATYNREQLSVFAIVKAAQLAIQFRLAESPHLKHRIQATFVDAADATHVAQQMLEMGMEVDDRNSALDSTGNRPRTSPTTGTTASHMMTTTPGYLRPMTAQSDSSNLLSISPASFKTAASTGGLHPTASSSDHSIRPSSSVSVTQVSKAPMLPPPHRNLSPERNPYLAARPPSVQSLGVQAFIPPRIQLPADFPPPAASSETAPFSTNPRSSKRKQPSSAPSTRSLRSRKNSTQAPSARTISPTITAPASALQSRPPILDERTTLLPPSPHRFVATSNFQTSLRPDTGVSSLGSAPGTAHSTTASIPTYLPSYPSPPCIHTSAQPSPAAEDSIDRVFRAISGNERQNVAQLAQYANQSKEERMDVINAMIVGNLESEDFRTLCRDVDACWRRQALGL
ncbi:Hypothetical protein D9617_32g092120 [Elsinoe fawcettii]|nr:Hypothetical protein D9617_32g092120 [Elsinoe fawcettii]